MPAGIFLLVFVILGFLSELDMDTPTTLVVLGCAAPFVFLALRKASRECDEALEEARKIAEPIGSPKRKDWTMLHKLDMTGYTKPVAWCVPSAVSILTGSPLTDTTSLLCRLSQVTYKDLEGVDVQDALLALHQFGYGHKAVPLYERYGDTLTHGPTLRRFLRERTPLEKMTPMLVCLPEHVIVCHMGFACDNWTKRPVPVGDFPKLGRLVSEAYLIHKL